MWARRKQINARRLILYGGECIYGRSRKYTRTIKRTVHTYRILWKSERSSGVSSDSSNEESDGAITNQVVTVGQGRDLRMRRMLWVRTKHRLLVSGNVLDKRSMWRQKWRYESKEKCLVSFPEIGGPGHLRAKSERTREQSGWRRWRELKDGTRRNQRPCAGRLLMNQRCFPGESLWLSIRQ